MLPKGWLLFERVIDAPVVGCTDLIYKSIGGRGLITHKHYSVCFALKEGCGLLADSQLVAFKTTRGSARGRCRSLGSPHPKGSEGLS